MRLQTTQNAQQTVMVASEQQEEIARNARKEDKKRYNKRDLGEISERRYEHNGYFHGAARKLRNNHKTNKRIWTSKQSKKKSHEMQ